MSLPTGKTGKLLPVSILRSKLVFEDLTKYCLYYSNNWSVPIEILNSNDDIKKEFLKALYDDEGSIIPQGKSAIVRLYSINKKGLLQVQKLINDFSIPTRIYSGFGAKRNTYAITIKDIELFSKKIGFNSIHKAQKLKEWVKRGT